MIYNVVNKQKGFGFIHTHTHIYIYIYNQILFVTLAFATANANVIKYKLTENNYSLMWVISSTLSGRSDCHMIVNLPIAPPS